MMAPATLATIRRVIPRLRFARLNPAEHAPLVHAWASQPRARFWMMGDYTVEDVREVYTWIDAQPTHGAWIVYCDAIPCALFQVYAPAADPVGDAYPALPGDLGIHAMMGPERIPDAPQLTAAVAIAAFARCFNDPTVQRLVAEPDAHNAAAIQRLVFLGFALGETVQLPHKRAQLAFLTRTDFLRSTAGL